MKIATVLLFRRNTVRLDLLRNENLQAIPRKTLDEKEIDPYTYHNLRNGEYDKELIIHLERNQSISKSLLLMLFDQEMKLIQKVLNGGHILLDSFKETIKKLFAFQFEKYKITAFQIGYLDSKIEDDEALFQIPENSAIEIQIE